MDNLVLVIPSYQGCRGPSLAVILNVSLRVKQRNRISRHVKNNSFCRGERSTTIKTSAL